MADYEPSLDHSRSQRTSLRYIDDRREITRKGRSNVNAASPTHQRKASSGQHFRVGNVAPNGQIYLRFATFAFVLQSSS